jgi:DNA-binding MarR family transcriptional regulator
LVKALDDRLLIDHVGVDLWRAASAWRERLHAEMVARGHAWYGDARGAVAAHLDPSGMSQSELVRRMGMTKQAVQQLLDGLVAEGIVLRELDPDDGRGRHVVYTQRGLDALRDAVTIKRAIERDCRASLGPAGFDALVTALRKLAPPRTPDGVVPPFAERAHPIAARRQRQTK